MRNLGRMEGAGTVPGWVKGRVMREHDIFVQITEDVCLNFSLRGVGVWQKMSPER